MSFDPRAVEVLLCDADGNLFPSEEPAFAASTAVTNELLGEIGVHRRFEPGELRRAAAGRNFRLTALELAERHGARLDDELLEAYVARERREVTERLRVDLSPDPDVLRPLSDLAGRLRLAVVTSSAMSRLEACLDATSLADLFAPPARFSAEDSLPAPASKPDPAIYRLAGERLGVTGARALAIEDATAGVLSAVAAGFPVVGNIGFVAPEERVARTAALIEAGVFAVVESWWELAELLGIPTLAQGAA